jgi:hypothetical protein
VLHLVEVAAALVDLGLMALHRAAVVLVDMREQAVQVAVLLGLLALAQVGQVLGGKVVMPWVIILAAVVLEF